MKILLYDIETDGVNTQTANFKFGGFYSSMTEGFKWTQNPQEMAAIINAHDIIVGYNTKEYDNEIMKRYGANFYGKTQIDLMEIIHGKNFGNGIGRKSIMQTPDGTMLFEVLHGKSLAETTRALGGPLKIGDFDYALLKKTSFSSQEQELILEYLQADIEATKYIYEYIEKFFADFKEYLTPTQIDKKYYLTSSVAALTYKIICNLAGIAEEYSDAEGESYEGGFVADPEHESWSGEIYCLDFTSLYPHIMMQANLYGRETTHKLSETWKGTGICTTIGTYNAKELAPVGKVLQQLFQKRLEYKRTKDARQYTIKIIINTIYGLLGNPVFKSVADSIAAADCTALGRQWINAARLHFKEHGYTLLYTDTDSVYLADPFHNKQKLLDCKSEFISQLKKMVPFPQDTFDMGVDAEIRYIAFFKGSSGELLKKNYLYVTKGGKLKIKGLPIIKSTATPLGTAIFADKIQPQIVNASTHKFARSQIEGWIEEYLQKDLTLASVFYKVKSADVYANASQIQAQIAQKFGEGQYKMIKLRCPHELGIGVNKNYIRVEDAAGISMTMIDFEKTWQELGHFIAVNQSKLSQFFK